MSEWKFERVEQKYETIPVGKYRLRIKNAEKATSKNSGNDMLILTFNVSGKSGNLIHYIPFLPERPEITNRMLTAFFDSFGIEDNNFNLNSWVGKCGGCQTKMESYNGKDRPKISYFLSKKQQEELPAWQDGENKKPDLIPIQDDSLPF